MGTEPSAANLVKLSGNFLLAAAIEALGEAIALVGKAGIDRVPTSSCSLPQSCRHRLQDLRSLDRRAQV